MQRIKDGLAILEYLNLLNMLILSEVT
jgi:hypothetical protein